MCDIGQTWALGVGVATDAYSSGDLAMSKVLQEARGLWLGKEVPVHVQPTAIAWKLQERRE